MLDPSYDDRNSPHSQSSAREQAGAASSTDANGDWRCPDCARIIRYRALPQPRLHRAALLIRFITYPLAIAWLYWMVTNAGELGGMPRERRAPMVLTLVAILPILALVVFEFLWIPKVRKIVCRNCGHTETKLYRSKRTMKEILNDLGESTTSNGRIDV